MTRKGTLRLLAQLLALLKPLWPVMVTAIALGVLGFLAAIFIPVLGGYGLVTLMEHHPLGLVPLLLIACGILRGILRYGEQALNHFIAFKLLAILRHKVFAKMRELAPAKLETKEKGDLLALMTSDIELLEVFYAHTVSPFFIAVIVSALMVAAVAYYSWLLAILLLCGYLLIGGVVPWLSGRRGNSLGYAFRTSFSHLNAEFLESLRGLREINQFNQQHNALNKVDAGSETLNQGQEKLSAINAGSSALMDGTLLGIQMSMLLVGMSLFVSGHLSLTGVVLCVLIALSSFGPVFALGNLASNLHQTLASARRVMALLDECPQVEPVISELRDPVHQASTHDLTFAYQEEIILNHLTLEIKANALTTIIGKSGSGKSTLAKLLMRFWQVKDDEIDFDGHSINALDSENLIAHQSYMSQESMIFHDTVENNLRIANAGASQQAIETAAIQAGIHDFILSLQEGYQTVLDEKGQNLSGGERQRLALARVFLHEADFYILDEPTSNLDGLNEAMIFSSLRKMKANKTILLISHRSSSQAIADRVIEMSADRHS